jgi:hypothetical protein
VDFCCPTQHHGHLRVTVETDPEVAAS